MTFVNDTWNEQQLEIELTQDEGLRLQVYKDTVGVTTIGVGYNIEANAVGLYESELDGFRDHGITAERAYQVLRLELAVCERQFDTFIPWWRSGSPTRQRVLLNMCYNLGWPRLRLFSVTLAHVRSREYTLASVSMLQSVWAKQVGAHATRLANMMRNG